MTDALTYDGARRLGHIIESYWASQGLKVITHIDEEREGKRLDALYSVRSDMINGQPTRKLARM